MTLIDHCPVPLMHGNVELAHGGGGRAMRRLIDSVFRPVFDDPALADRHDSAVLPAPEGRIALTTDGYVIKPLFFPGGDIGKLAVVGTVNDLAMAGAAPLYLTVSFILEEGLPLEDLRRIATSMSRAAQEAGIRIVTGDTKVVDRGNADGVYISTAGVGRVFPGLDVRPQRVEPGDAILLSGDLGRHGLAVLSVRRGLEFETGLESDCTELASAVKLLAEHGVTLHCLRDLTRGGLTAALNEVALDVGLRVQIEEQAIPVSAAVDNACELFGLDSLQLANEGRFVAFIPESEAARALEILRAHPACGSAARIGRVSGRAAENRAGSVVLSSPMGGTRVLDLPYSDPLPRIC